MSTLDPLALPLQGTTLIEASAGTGKTHTITTLYLRLLLERELTPSQILVVTYTNAATAELRGRVRSRIRQAIGALTGEAPDASLTDLVVARQQLGSVSRDLRRLNDALNSFDEAAIFTIHGFCQRVLHENAFESGVSFDSELLTDINALVGEVVCDFWVSRLAAAPELNLAYLEKRGTTVGTLKQLASRILSQRHLLLLPKPGDSAADPALPHRWQTTTATLAEVWQNEQDKILDLLTGPALKQITYKPDKIRNVWAPALTATLASRRPLLRWHFARIDKLTSEALRDGARKGAQPPTHRFFDACSELASIEDQMERSLAEWRLRLLHDFAGYLETELRRRKLEQSAQSFDDLLRQLDDSLASPSGGELAEAVRRRYPAALIDEFQDTDPVQYDIFRRLYLDREGCLFLIGDPKQAIYGFRGADIFTYVRARADTGNEPKTLETNRRSDPRLLAAINAVFTGARNQFVIEEIPYREIHAPAGTRDRLGPDDSRALEILLVQGDDLTRAGADKGDACKDRIADATAVDIVRLLASSTTIDGRPLAPADIAVLTRTNEQTQRMQNALRRHRLHSVLQTEESVFESPDALDAQRILLAIEDPADGRALRAALITAPFGLDGNQCQQLEADERQWDTWVNRFQKWRQLWDEHGFVVAFRALLDDQAVAARLLGRIDGERRLTNLLHLMELLHTAAVREHLGPLALAHWLAVMRSDEVARSSVAVDAVQIRLESDAAAVKLVTVHKSKGLEYPIVYCPYLWLNTLSHRAESTFPRYHDPAEGNALVLRFDGAGPGDKDRLERENLAESLRLLYVALTRARHRVAVVWGAFGQLRQTALGYLLHQPLLASDSDVVAKTWERLSQIDEAGVCADLQALVERCPDAIGLRTLDLFADDIHEADRTGTAALEPRAPAPQVRLALRTSSFSGLTASAPADEASAEGVDHDVVADDEASVRPTPADDERVRLADFPAGARAGLLIHKVFELLDFPRAESMLERIIDTHIERYGVPAEWGPTLAPAIVETLDTPLENGCGGLRLREVTNAQRRNEVEFLLPVGELRAPPLKKRRRGALPHEAPAPVFTAAGLAQVFRQHASDRVPKDYADSLARLKFAELRGFLKGFIDLFFVHDGRWHVADYKSNRLGLSPRDYAFAPMQRAMSAHHYFLQYHLYTLALHRHWRQRLPSYDYDRDFGGVFYLFLRGMQPGGQPGHGVFFDRPSQAMIEALDRMLQ